jgi:hypothetical protein
MAGLSPQKIAMLRALVAASPDELVRVLESAISADGAGGPLAAIGAMVEAEASERALRFAVLAPVAPLFRPATDEGRPAFPRGALGALWLALKDDAPGLVREAADAMHYLDPEEPSPSVFDELCARAAKGLIDGDRPGYAAAAAACEAARQGSAADLILCLQMAPIARPAILRLGDWIQRMTDERRATARLAYRDATGLADGAGPLLFEMLAGHLKHPSAILRIISAVMDRPGERYVADSELARFGERSLAEIEDHLTVIKAMKPGAGIASGREAGQAVQRAIDAVNELEQAIQLSRDGPWGQRLSKLKQAIAVTVEGRLKDIDDAATQALPMQKIRYSARLTRTAPNLDAPPNEPAIAWAMGLLTFADVVRVSATDGGFGTVRSKVLDALGKRIDQYVEDLLEQIRLGEVEDNERAREYLGVAADMLALARDDKSAAIVRRRAAAA